MDDPGKCPQCDADIDYHVIGWGEYPINYSVGKFSMENHFRGGKAIAYECQKCFTKCCHHALNDGDMNAAKRHYYDGDWLRKKLKENES